MQLPLRICLRLHKRLVTAPQRRPMHLPPHNAEHRPAVLYQFMRDNPLGILTTAIKSSSHPFLQSSHIPWIIDIEANGDTSDLGRLRGHIARQNPQAKAIIESLTTENTAPNESSSLGSCLEEDVLILFNGPVHAYITPKFYIHTKPASGKVVPTWNYEAVQVYGRAKIYHDSRSADTDAFLNKALEDLTQHAETSVMGYGKDEKSEVRPWKVDDAPERYIELLKKGIIGIEISITDMAGRVKMSQEKPVGDREGVIEGFRGLDTRVGREMAAAVDRVAKMYDARKAEKAEK